MHLRVGRRQKQQLVVVAHEYDDDEDPLRAACEEPEEVADEIEAEEAEVVHVNAVVVARDKDVCEPAESSESQVVSVVDVVVVVIDEFGSLPVRRTIEPVVVRSGPGASVSDNLFLDEERGKDLFVELGTDLLLPIESTAADVRDVTSEATRELVDDGGDDDDEQVDALVAVVVIEPPDELVWRC